MLYSMTGFGRAEATVNGRQVAVEIKSLNGKQFEVNTKIPPILRSYELDLRTLLSNLLMRGSLDLTISIRQEGASKPMMVNTALAVYYYQSMLQISEQLNLPKENILSTLMRMPEVVAAEQDVLPEAEWLEVKVVVEEAARQLMQHRKHEGEALYKDLHLRIRNIENLLETIIPHEMQRADKIRTKLTAWLEDMEGKGTIDANRFEQEMIYYLERMDFTEEKTRLKQHCQYFHDTINKQDQSVGKKLGFILQEIGRMLHTINCALQYHALQFIYALVLVLKADAPEYQRSYYINKQ